MIETAIEDVAFERHYTAQEIGKMWHLSHKTVRRWFRDEPGVICMRTPDTARKRGYTTLRIPESVMQRVHRKLRDGVA